MPIQLSANSIRKCLVFLIFSCLVLSFLEAPASDLFTQDSNREVKRSVVAEGRASILQGDVTTAREFAINDARKKALEEIGGVYIDSATLVQNALVLSTAVRSRTFGLVSDYAIIDERREGDIYYVKINAIVIPAEYEERLRNIVSKTSIIVQIAETSCGQNVDRSLVEEVLIEKLVAAGFAVLDRRQADTIRQRDQQLLAGSDTSTARRVSLRFLSNIIITGQVEARESERVSERFVFCRTSGSVRAVEASTARILASASVQRIKTAKNSCANACELGRIKAGEELARELMTKLTEAIDREKQHVTIEVHGVESEQEAARLTSEVSLLRWVSGATLESFEATRRIARISLDYTERTVFLASHFNRHGRYILVDFDENRILLKKK